MKYYYPRCALYGRTKHECHLSRARAFMVFFSLLRNTVVCRSHSRNKTIWGGKMSTKNTRPSVGSVWCFCAHPSGRTAARRVLSTAARVSVVFAPQSGKKMQLYCPNKRRIVIVLEPLLVFVSLSKLHNPKSRKVRIQITLRIIFKNCLVYA